MMICHRAGLSVGSANRFNPRLHENRNWHAFARNAAVRTHAYKNLSGANAPVAATGSITMSAFKERIVKIRDVSAKYDNGLNKSVIAALCLLGGIAGSGVAHADGDALLDAFTGGHATIEERARVQFVNQVGKSGAAALTLRSLIGFSTKPVDGLSATVQFLNVADLTSSYNSGANGKTRYAAILDPSVTNLNQANIAYTGISETIATIGRQIINLDDVRFVGNVDFRQNMQTFDAVTAANKTIDNLKVQGSYIWGIKNILNRHIPTQTYLVEGWYTPTKEVQLDAFGYWYGNEAKTVILGAAGCGLAGAAACNSRTLGARIHGTVPLPQAISLEYKGTYAAQDPYDGGSALIDADYVQASVKAIWNGYFIGAEYMLMGSNSNGTYAFQTPLATKHAFNGWDEIFLTTPAKGLQAEQINIGGKVLGANLIAKYYDFKSDYRGLSYGHEWDLSATYQFSTHWLIGAEYAAYTAKGFGADTQAGYAYVTMRY
jgi:hypothetical protein